LDSSIYLGSNSSYSASKDDGVFMEGASEDDDDDVSSITSHQDEKKDDKKEDKPPVELMLDFQVIILTDLLK
jgi:vacuolar protein sorting-associated protein 13A/C